MSIAPTREPRFLRASSALVVAAAVCTLLAGAGVASAQQSSAQQKCLLGLYKSASKVGSAQSKNDVSCVKNRQARKSESLGNPGQEQTADACLTNDVKGGIAKKSGDVTKTFNKKCTVQAPDFGSAPPEQMAGAGGQIVQVPRDLFGPNMQQIIKGTAAYDDKAGLACQPETLKAAGKLYDTLWKEMQSAAKGSLSGKTGPAATTGAQLEAAITSALAADAKGKIAKLTTALTDTVAETCGATTEDLFDLFRGKCPTNTSAAFGACVLSSTRCHFCRGMRGATGLDFDCDAFDDAATNDSCTGFATAHEITNPAEFITGPLASGRLGDTMMANGLARYIIQKANVRDMYSVGGFGGNIIDAELVGHEGLDNFLEIQPAINIETVINATSLDIVNDGADGGAAIVRTCGPDDLLDFVNPSTVIAQAGLNFPPDADDKDQDVTGCTDYILEPDTTYLKVVTTVFNNEAADLPVFAGDYVNAAGELEQWGSTSSESEGIGVRLLGPDMGIFDFFGYGEARGVDYGIVPIPDANIKTGYFSVSGVSYLLHSQSVLDALINHQPKFVVPAGGSRSFTRYFGVGDGSGGNAITLENAVKGTKSGTISGCVTVGGNPAPGARVSGGPVSAGQITRVVSTWVTGPDGCFSGTVPVSSNGYAAWREGTMYEGGAATPTVHVVNVPFNGSVIQNFALPAPGHVAVNVVDENSNPVPGRISIVGFDPSPDPKFSADTGLFLDQTDRFPFGIVYAAYTDSAGAVDFDLEPGSYRVYVSRGAEWSLFSQAITVVGGATNNVNAQIAHVLDTTGFISSDHHVHAIASADSRVSNADRVRQFAGEGVDNIIITDHHHHTDLTPKITELGFTNFVNSTIGEEITTWDTGHYNAYPMSIDPTRPSLGSTDWGGAAPAGQDFPSAGNYILEPAQVENLALTEPSATADTVVQINHITDHFVPMKIDTSLVPPQTSLDAAGRLSFRMNPAGGELFHHFKALELWNGDGRSHQSQFLDERIGIWFNLLNQGLISTFITDTDTHKFANMESAGGRTWTASATDVVANISPAVVAQSVRDGKAVGGQGIYVQTKLVDAAIPANVADLTLAGSTLLTVSNPVAGLTLEIDVQAPLWAEFDKIRVYANAATIPSPTSPEPELFSATPTMTLNSGVDFTVTTNNVFPLVTGGMRREAHVSIPFTNMTDDTWFVVVVKGTDGVSRPLFPVSPANLATGSNTTLANLTDGNLNESGTLALGATNALYADVDGNPGFDAPLAP
jgi:hypothetical protein